MNIEVCAKSALYSAVWARFVTAEELERAARGFSIRSLPKGTYLLHAGDNFEHWVGVSAGLLKVGAVSSGGNRLTFVAINAGGWFGEGSILKNELRKYDVVAMRDTMLGILNRSTFFWLYENSQGFNRFLIRQMNERIGQLLGSMEYQKFLSPSARIARSIYWLLNPVLNPGARDCIEITQEELGLLTGLSRAYTNGGLNQLTKTGLIEYHRGVITVTDISKLATYE